MGSLSLMSGWLPVTVQVLTVMALVRAIGWRSRHWRLVLVPVAAAVGTSIAVVAHWSLAELGMASEPAPWQLWPWVGLSGLAVAAAVAGWPGAGWSRRNLSVFAASLCLLSTGLTVNGWIGYSPTVDTAWNQLTAGPLPDETDWETLTLMRRAAIRPDRGAVVRVRISAAASGFEHRDEFVYLPPAWFTATPPPRLPTIMMIGGQFTTPADWLRVGGAASTLDAFAAEHDGRAPVAVFVDPSGGFTNDTECVNGPRGNAADHLTKDVVPQLVADFGVSAQRSQWSIAGFSTGGTCALNLVVMNPDQFGVFVDIAGDSGPSAGTKAQTIDRLFGGDANAWSAFDPATVIARRGRFTDVSGLFVVPGSSPADPGGAGRLCALGAAKGIDCQVVTLPGRHVWPFGGAAFAATLPWLAARLGIVDAIADGVPASRR